MRKKLLIALLLLNIVAVAQTIHTPSDETGGGGNGSVDPAAVGAQIHDSIDSLKTNGVPGVVYSEIITMARGGYDSTQMITAGFLQMPLEISMGFMVDTVYMVGVGASVDVDIKLYHGASLASGTAIDNTAYTVNSVTKGIKASSGFESATIPKGNWVWAVITEATTKCRRILIIIKGHRI